MTLWKMEKVAGTAIASCLLVALAGCGSGGEDEAVALEGSNWQLVQITVPGGFVFTPEDPADYVLNFRSENRLTGTSDCNRITGSWQQQGTELSFEPFATTRSLCPPPTVHNYLSLYLRDVTGLRASDDRLFLTTTTEGVELEYQARE